MIIIIIDDRILNFLDGILIGIFRWENVLNFHGRKKIEVGGKLKL